MAASPMNYPAAGGGAGDQRPVGRAEDPAASTRAGRSGGSCPSEPQSQAACAEEKGQQREQAEVFPAVQGMLLSSST